MDSAWFKMVPVFVTRKTAGDLIYHIAIPLWMTLVLAILVLFNMLLWGGYGIYEFFRVVT